MRIREVEPAPDGATAVFALDPDSPLRTSDVPGLRPRLIEALPGLANHRCTAATSGFLVSELADTELVHAVEHAALELLAMAGFPRTIRGSTDWDFAADGPGVFRVRVAGCGPDAGEAALRAAAAMLAALGAGDAPTPAAETVSALAAFRR